MTDGESDDVTRAPAPAADEATAAAQTAPDERLQRAEAEVQDLKDRLLRTLAEMENLRRRTEREVQDARSYGISRFALDMVGTADNLRRALDSVPADAAPSEGPLKTLMDGIELTEREFLKALERHGVKKREPLGEKFDPNRDQAMFEVPDASRPAGTVVQVVQPGYTLGERVLRATLVGVSKGAPAENAPAVDRTV